MTYWLRSLQRLCLIGLCFPLVLGAPIFARSLDDIQQSGKILIAVYSDFPPFSFKQKNRELGIDVEIAKAIAQGLNVDLELIWSPADENVEDDMRNNLWKGRVYDKRLADLMLRVPNDREFSLKRDDVGLPAHEMVHMFGPYHTETWQIAYNKRQLPAVPNMAVFRYHPIAVEVDTSAHFFLTTAFAGQIRDKTHHFLNIGLAFDALVNKQVDAVLGLRSQLGYFANTKKLQQLGFTEHTLPLPTKPNWDIGMAVKKDYRQLAYAVEDIILNHITSGQMRIWFEQYAATYQAPKKYQPVN